MHSALYNNAKLRSIWSALLLVLLGLCSFSTSHRIAGAAVHQRTVPGSGSTQRTSRHNGRSLRGGIRTDLDTHGAETDRASQGVRPNGVDPLDGLFLVGLPAAKPVQTPSPMSSELAETDATTVAEYVSRTSRGRAPPSL